MSAISSSDEALAGLLVKYLELANKLWVAPADGPTLTESRKYLEDALLAAVAPAVWSIWRHQLPASKEKTVTTLIKRGIRIAFKTLRSNGFPDVLGLGLWIIPNDWQPPAATRAPSGLPVHQEQVYRLTAAFIALSIHHNLAVLGAGKISISLTPEPDRAVLNAVHGVLLANPGHTWNFSLPARWLVQCALMKIEGAELPPVAGG